MLNSNRDRSNHRGLVRWLTMGLIASIALTILVLFSPLIPPPLAMANTGTIIRASASPTRVPINGIVIVDINIDNVSNLYGAEVHLTFSPNVLQAQDMDVAKPGVQIEPGPFLTPSSNFIAVNRADNGAGKIDFALTQLNPAPAVSGSGKFARIKFKAVANGTATIHFASAILANRNGGAIPVSMQDTLITVGATPTPTPTPKPTPVPTWATRGKLLLDPVRVVFCSSRPQWVTLSGKSLLSPHKSQAILETEYHTIYPQDQRTAPHYDYRVVRDDEPFVFSVYMPGARPRDKLIDVKVTAILQDSEGEPIMRFPVTAHVICTNLSIPW